MKIRCENKTRCFDITINLKNSFLDKDKVFLDPFVIQNGLINVLKKNRIIKTITGVTTYNNVSIPIAKLNMGILKSYDKDGVMKYLSYKEGFK